MSDVSVDIIKNRSGEAPDLPSGANLSGVSTAATLQVTNLNSITSQQNISSNRIFTVPDNNIIFTIRRINTKFSNFTNINFQIKLQNLLPNFNFNTFKIISNFCIDIVGEKYVIFFSSFYKFSHNLL